MVKPSQGDIYWVKFGHSGDSGPSGKRPAIIIQNDLLNKSKIQTTIVVLLTSNLKLRDVPGNIELIKGTANLPKASVVIVSQISTIAKNRLLEKIGTLSRKTLEQVIKECQRVIHLDYFHDNVLH